uniref:Endonuclease n=1 Tax=Ralstonia phage BOESR1 TaxID=3034917 RepID=A0AA49IHR8_9CAUD|nr:endonuclease [Ralstonia phage BOESR1]
MWNAARQRAKVKGLEFSITQDWVEERLQAGRCEVTGIPFDFTFNRIWSPSLDRVDNALGYTPENTRMVVFIYNSAKNTGTDADVLQMATALVAANDN